MATAPITRFAPSPTGRLHLGHAFSALVASRLGGGYRLRIDDIDHMRCCPEYTEQIYDDLAFLDLPWRGEPVFQSDRLDRYAQVLDKLREMDLIYPCFLTRAELAKVLSAPHEPLTATDVLLSADEAARRAGSGMAPAWRLRTAKALELAENPTWLDLRTGSHHSVDMSAHGDVIVARRDIGTSYHLSVVVDDMIDGVTLVTRGMDLKASTDVHRLLQAILKIPAPAYYHHDLVCDEDGHRLAKRHDALSISELRQSGLSATEILSYLPDFAESAIINSDYSVVSN